MTLQDILITTGAGDTDGMKADAKRLIEIYYLLEGEKENIVSITMEAKKIMFGRTFKWYQNSGLSENDRGKEIDGRRVVVTTSHGNYSFLIPDKKPVFYWFCQLLNYEVDKIPVDQPEPVLQSFTFPIAALKTIQAAKAFVSKDKLRPVFLNVAIEINEGKAQVIASDAHRLFMSQIFDVTGPAGAYIYQIPADQLKSLPKVKAESFEFNAAENSVTVAGKKLSRYTEYAYVNWRVCVPDYKTGIMFDKKDFIRTVKTVLPYSNKSTNQVYLTFNGCIEATAQDIDFSTESNARMCYKKNEVGEMAVAFNGKFLLEAMKALEGNEITMLSAGGNSKPGIFTDGTDQVLIMALMLLVDIEDMDVLPEPEKTEPVPAAASHTISSEVERYREYIAGLLAGNYSVTVHRYLDGMEIRWVVFKDKKIERGEERVVELSNEDMNHLGAIVAELGQQHSKEIINFILKILGR